MSIENPILSDLLNPVVDICIGAGEAILEIYNSDDFVNATDVQTKGDDSPLTKADLAAHKHIVAALSELTPNIPILSEESAAIDWETRRSWERYWLVDPLDGTKEFIKRNGEFTVNIALIEKHEAILGVVHVPAKSESYYAARDVGAYKRDAEGTNHFIQVRKPANKKPIVVGSRSHQSEALKTYLDTLGEHEMTPMGSSLKLCLVAEGAADLYPRLGLTSEWDTAAAQAVVEIAGGEVVTADRNPLLYNSKESLLNPWFMVFGDSTHDWCKGMPEQTD
jgi:3'(2'), 5'-bisphosphate nucleotidase